MYLSEHDPLVTRLFSELARIERLLRLNLLMESELMIDYNEINTTITEQSTEIDSVIAFVQGQKDSNATLQKQVDDLTAQLATNSDAAIQSALTGLKNSIKANNDHLATVLPAIVANTPSAPADPNAPAASTNPDPNAPAQPAANP